MTDETFSSKSVHEGDQISLRLGEDLTVNGVRVVLKGTRVRGEIVEAEKAGFLGKAGKLNMRVSTIRAVDGQKITVRSQKQAEGQSKVGTTIALTALLGPLGLLKRGKDVTVLEGTKIAVYVDEDILLKGCSPVAGEPTGDMAPASASDARPKIGEGSTFDDVKAAFGDPQKAVTVGEKTIWTYDGMRLVFLRGKVVEVQ